MKLKPPDSSLADYQERLRVFVTGMRISGATKREMLDGVTRWTDANSPFTWREKLANLRRALNEDDDA